MQVAGIDGVADGLGQRPGVADAGGAAVADQVEAERVQVPLQPGRLEVVGHHLGARRQRGLDPGLDLEAAFARLAGEEPGGDHDARVRGVGAGGDRGDHHVAVAQRVVGARDRHRLIEVGADAGLDRLLRGLRHSGERDPVLGPLGAGQAGLDAAQIELHDVAEVRLGRVVLAPQALRLGVGLDQRHARPLAAGKAEIADGFRIDGEEAAGRAVLGSHVGDGRAVGEPEPGQTRAGELDELADHALGAQDLGHGEHQVGRRRALLERAREPHPDDLGNQHGDRLAEHRRLGLDAADAPAEHRQAVDHGGVAVGADQGIGIGERGAAGTLALGVLGVLGPDDLGQILQVDLMADAGTGRHHAEIIEGILAPAQEGVALAVALEFPLDVDLEGARRAEGIDHDRVVDHEIDRRQRVDPLGLAAEVLHRLAHGGEIDHRRHPGEVLHEYARRAVADLPVRAPVLEPFADGFGVLDGHGAAVLVAQQVLEQDLERERQAGDVAEAGLGGRL